METTLTQPLTLLDAFRSFLTDKADVDIVKFLLGVFILDADDGFGRHFLSSCRSGHLRERKNKVRMYYYLCSCTLMYLPITRQDHYNSIHSVTMKQNVSPFICLTWQLLIHSAFFSNEFQNSTQVKIKTLMLFANTTIKIDLNLKINSEMTAMMTSFLMKQKRCTNFLRLIHFARFLLHNLHWRCSHLFGFAPALLWRDTCASGNTQRRLHWTQLLNFGILRRSKNLQKQQ